jgi:hypothetical protein
MPDKDDAAKAGEAHERRAKPNAAAEEEAAQEQPLPDQAELEQLRARLIAQYRGRR